MQLDYKNGLARYRKYLEMVQTRPVWRMSLMLVFSLILTIVMLVVALKPTLMTISGLIGQISQRKEVVKKMNDKIYRVQLATKLLNEAEAKLPVLDESMPEGFVWGDWAKKLELLATQSGVKTNQISVTEVMTTKGEARFTMSGSGQYEQILQWIVMLENMRRIVIIDSLQISSAKNELTAMINGRIGFETRKEASEKTGQN